MVSCIRESNALNQEDEAQPRKEASIDHRGGAGSFRSGSVSIFAGWLFAFSCAPEHKVAEDRTNPSYPLPDTLIEAIDAELSDHVEKSSAQASSAAISIVHRSAGVILERYYGNWGRDDPFFLASLSKVAAAGVLLRLEDLGHIELDAPTGLFGLSGGGEASLSVAQLLSNSSGLRCPRNTVKPSRWDCQFDDQDRLVDCARLVWETHRREELFEPADEAFCYGGAQWQLAGAIAEMAAGQSWSELFRSTYVEPCQLENSGFTNQYSANSDPKRRWADYPHLVSTQTLSANPNIEGGMFSTVPDFSKILLMLLRQGKCSNGQVLSERSVRKMLSDRIWDSFKGSISDGFASADLEAFGTGYGLGWWVKRSTQERIVPGAYGSTAWISPQGNFAVLLALKSNGIRGRELFVSLNPKITEAMQGYP